MLYRTIQRYGVPGIFIHFPPADGIVLKAESYHGRSRVSGRSRLVHLEESYTKCLLYSEIAEGQHQSPLELIRTNLRTVLSDVINKLESAERLSYVDYTRYKIDWICSLLVRVGLWEDSALTYLLGAARTLSAIDTDCDLSSAPTPSLIKAGLKGRPEFDITREQLEYFVQNGFKATDIAGMFCVSVKTVHRRLQENGMSIRDSYAKLTEHGNWMTLLQIFCMNFPTLDIKACEVICCVGDIKFRKIVSGKQ